MKKVLVFGAAGFMGTYLIDTLIKNGYNVIATDIGLNGKKFFESIQVPYFEVDITKADDFKILPREQYDAVIHLAAHQPANVSENSFDPKDYFEVNVVGTLNILNFCKSTNSKKIIYASSHRNTQGLWNKERVGIRENEGRSIKFDTEYTLFSISESAAQDCVSYYQTQQNLNSIIFRLPPVYGYGPHTEIFKNGKQIKTGFQIFIEKAMSCKPIEVWGDVEIGRDIIYIKDVIAAFIKAIEIEKASGLYNITSGRKLTLKEEAETIAKVFWGDENEPIIDYRPEIDNGIESFYYDISKAKKELSWVPAYSFEDMLYDFIKEEKSKKYSYLVDKRKQQFDSDSKQ